MAGLAVDAQHYLPAINTSDLVLPAMHALSSLFVLGSCAVQAVLGRPEAALHAKRSLDSFVSEETRVAWSKLLCNIGPNGCATEGAVAAGAVLASPSKVNPDYWYTWSRDSALVLTGIVDEFTRNYDPALQTIIENYITAQARLQGISNPSGDLSNGAGLGEPKFEANLTAFTGDWGRPQRDGPPLRAIALTRYANWLVANGHTSTAKTVVWPVIKNDLAYTAQYWNETGFDLWEEVPGSSFWTIASTHRALVEGAALSAQLDTECRACITVAPQVLCFQQSFWNSSGNYIVSNINTNNGRTGKDANSVLTSIHNFDPSVGCDVTTFQPCSDKALGNHKAYVDSFRSVYPLNAGIPEGKAIAVGRYAEDVYYTGNPWYLSNFAAAEQLYDAIYVWKQQRSITVTSISLPFFRDLIPSIQTGTYPADSRIYRSILDAVSTYADGFLSFAAKYTPANGSLSEQYNHTTGTPTSANDLTWSYAAFISAASRRAGIVPAGWGAQHGKLLPTTCSRVEVAGTYVLATSTTFPSNQRPDPAAGAAPSPFPSTCANAEEVYVTFNARVTTQWGETVKVVGSAPELGSWNVSSAPALSATGYTATDPLWAMTVPMQAVMPGDDGSHGGSTVVQYKYVKVESDGSVVWEADPNRNLTLAPAPAGKKGACAALAVSDTWR